MFVGKQCSGQALTSYMKYFTFCFTVRMVIVFSVKSRSVFMIKS